mgnify:CR=1
MTIGGTALRCEGKRAMGSKVCANCGKYHWPRVECAKPKPPAKRRKVTPKARKTREDKTADRIDGFDRDDIGSSPDY